MEAKMPHPFLLFLEKHRLRAGRALFRIKSKITGNKRLSSYPYLSGDSFRAIADHIYDETQTFEPEVVQPGDIVFVNNPLTRSYLTDVHPRIKHPYVLIEHNGDYPIDKSIADLLDDKIIHFYAQDVVYDHEKIIPIPIGLENYHIHQAGVPGIYTPLIKKVEKHTEKIKAKRKNRILFRFSTQHNPEERAPAHAYFSQHPLMETFTTMLPPTFHAEKLTTYKFVASPPGNSIESSRTWEALYLKTIPIVKDFTAYRYFASTGLPMWIVKDWKELEGLTEESLAKKYDEFMANAKWDALYMDFWIAKIKADQATVRAPHSS